MHAVQKHIGHGVGVRDLDHARSCLVLLRDVRLEGGPALCAGDEGLEAGEELTSVADSQGESVLTFKEGLEFFADVGVEQDGGGPATTRAQDIACEVSVLLWGVFVDLQIELQGWQIMSKRETYRKRSLRMRQIRRSWTGLLCRK